MTGEVRDADGDELSVTVIVGEKLCAVLGEINNGSVGQRVMSTIFK